MRHRTLTAVALALGAALLLTVAPLRAADPVEIDVLLPMTGTFSFGGQATIGTLTAIEALVNRTGGIRGRPLHFVVHDDQSNPATAVQLMSDAIAKKPAVVLGPSLGATCLATAPLSKSGPVQYCFSPVVHPPPGSFVFSGNISTQAYAVVFYRYFKTRGIKSFALIASTDASGQDADNEFEHQLALPENSGLTMVAHEHFNVSDISVAAQMSRIKAAAPQAVICYAAGTPFGTLLRGVQQAGIDVPIFTGSANMTLAEMKQFGDALPKELYFPGFGVLANVSRNPKEKAAQDRFLAAEKQAGITPDGLTLASWDPTFIVIDALRTIGPTATAEQIRAYIANLHDYVGVFGAYDFRDGSQRGLAADNLVVERWDPQKNGWIAASDFGGGPLKR